MAAARALVVSILALASVPIALAAANTGPLASLDCPDSEKVAPAAVEVDDFEVALARYAGLPGFVELVSDSQDPHGLIAVFDEAYAPTPLPADDNVGGFSIRVVADTFTPLIASSNSSPPTIPVACSGQIRPGMGISTPVGGCSLNFIFTAGGNTYAGTAGHCFSALNQRMTVSTIGSVGTVVYFINAGVGNDFALVQIDANQVSKVNAAMCHWGGPTGPDPTTIGGVVRHYGSGIGYGTNQFTRPRSGYALSSTNANSFAFNGLVASGDSGSGARQDNGLAMGIITHVNGGGVLVAHSAPFAYGTRVSRAISLAEAATGLDLTLATAPVA